MRKYNRNLWLLPVAAFVFGLGVFTSEATAQNWDMAWSGRVDDTVQVRVRGRSATVRTIAGRRTTGISSSFRAALPRNNNVRVSVRKRDGRGDVRVIQQPANFNNYTAIIEIRDRDGGADNYRFELNWGGGFDDDDFRPGNPNFSGNAEMTWQGRVDDRVQVRVRNRIATTRTIDGRAFYDARYNFRRALPSSSVFVSVDKRDGRGSVRVIEQPTRFNGYSALIEIRDSAGGSDFYSFELNWRGGNNGPVFPDNGRGSMTWRGSVDDTVRVSIRGRSAVTRTLRGQATVGVNFNFNEALPRRSVYVRVDKRNGRGSVRVIQQPTSRNNYTAIVEIRDSSGGRDGYVFDLNW